MVCVLGRSKIITAEGKKIYFFYDNKIKELFFEHEIVAVSMWQLENGFFALDVKGKVFQWGSFEESEINDDEINPKEIFFPYSGKIIQIASGYNHTLLLTDEGVIYGVGDNILGQLGIPVGQTNFFTRLTVLDSLINGGTVKQIAAGFFHTVALTSNNEIIVWGANAAGQLGLGEDSARTEKPQKVNFPESIGIINQVVASECNTLLFSDKGVFICGANSKRQLGLDEKDITDKALTFQPMPLLHQYSICDIVHGDQHFIATTTLKKRIYWGNKLATMQCETQGAEVIFSEKQLPEDVFHVQCGPVSTLLITRDKKENTYQFHFLGKNWKNFNLEIQNALKRFFITECNKKQLQPSKGILDTIPPMFKDISLFTAPRKPAKADTGIAEPSFNP